MKRLLLLVAGCAGALVLASDRAEPAARPAPAWAGTCGLPQASPIWIDYGWPSFAPIFARRGVVLAVSSGDFPQQMRAAGANTVYWDMYLVKHVGDPLNPADAATALAKADKTYQTAAQQMGCATPVIVENELFGAALVTPWSDTNAQYRQNVLAFLQRLAADGAHPVLLVNNTPYTAGDAGVWWQQVAAVADVVREDYVPANLAWNAGPIVGNRMLRTAYRRSIEDFTSIGIPPQRLGIMVSFSTTRGFGGRNGLEPTSAWLQVAKWQALSAREVAAETAIGSIWSWGWGTWSKAESDPDKSLAACAWLWARSPSLCDAPDRAGRRFDTSRSEGQITLSPGIQCTVGGRALSNDAIQRLQLLTGDRDTAFSALYERLVEARYAPLSPVKVLAAERALVAEHFGGSRSAYLAALAQAHVPIQIARGVLGDELRRARVEARFPVRAPSTADVRRFYSSYPDLLVRPVRTKPGAPWLGGRTRGLILSATAPQQLFSGGARRVWTPSGFVRVTPLGNAEPLGSVPFEQARPAIAAALRAFSRGEAFERWTESRQSAALSTAICARDDLPQPAAVELTTFLPFLQLAL
jgi:hypothetical protein